MTFLFLYPEQGIMLLSTRSLWNHPVKQKEQPHSFARLPLLYLSSWLYKGSGENQMQSSGKKNNNKNKQHYMA